MREDAPQHFSEEEASRIWRRAAELQARRRLPTPADEQSGGGIESPAELEPRLSGEEIVAVAREAGIAPEFVRQALTEAHHVPPLDEDAEHPPLRTRRTIHAPSAFVQEVVQEVAAADPYRLRLTDFRTAGAGLTLLFEISGDWGQSWERSALRAGDLGAGRNATSVHAVLLPSPDASHRTELMLYCPPNPDLSRSIARHNIGFGGIGVVGGGVGIGALAAEALALSGAVIFAPAAVGALALGGAGVHLVRVLHRWSRRKDSASLEKLADDIAGAVRIRRMQSSLPPAAEPGLEP